MRLRARPRSAQRVVDPEGVVHERGWFHDGQRRWAMWPECERCIYAADGAWAGYVMRVTRRPVTCLWCVQDEQKGRRA